MAAIGASMQVQPAKILLVEDNPGDVRLVREALRESKIISQLHAVSDGKDALDFLRKQGNYANATRPDLILLDLNLPGKDGREVLSEIKIDPDLLRIPVVILTSSKAEEDIVKSYNDHANCYVTKPLDLETFIEVVEAIQGFWISVVKLPAN
jgi:chemotaxis family two-component system response regulator Rcp1